MRTMKKPLPETLSISEVIRYIFPYMSAATIHLWMAKGIFMPETYVPKPSGRSRGCQLSLSDMGDCRDSSQLVHVGGNRPRCSNQQPKWQ